MSKAYVVMEVGYEYNDETYDRTEGGHPVKIFTDRNEAEALRDKREAQRRKDYADELPSYCGECDWDGKQYGTGLVCQHKNLHFYRVETVDMANG